MLLRSNESFRVSSNVSSPLEMVTSQWLLSCWYTPLGMWDLPVVSYFGYKWIKWCIIIRKSQTTLCTHVLGQQSKAELDTHLPPLSTRNNCSQDLFVSQPAFFLRKWGMNLVSPFLSYTLPVQWTVCVSLLLAYGQGSLSTCSLLSPHSHCSITFLPKHTHSLDLELQGLCWEDTFVREASSLSTTWSFLLLSFHF